MQIDIQIVKALEQILADIYALYFKTQNYHWNVQGGPEFRSLHKLFEKQYKDLEKSLDEVAERIRSLDAKVPALSNLISSICEANPNLSSNEMVKSLAEDQDKILCTLNKALKISRADEGTYDIIVQRIKVHEKNRWMLKSSVRSIIH